MDVAAPAAAPVSAHVFVEAPDCVRQSEQLRAARPRRAQRLVLHTASAAQRGAAHAHVHLSQAEAPPPEDPERCAHVRGPDHLVFADSIGPKDAPCALCGRCRYVEGRPGDNPGDVARTREAGLGVAPPRRGLRRPVVLAVACVTAGGGRMCRLHRVVQLVHASQEHQPRQGRLAACGPRVHNESPGRAGKVPLRIALNHVQGDECVSHGIIGELLPFAHVMGVDIRLLSP